ncbi:MAG: nucleoside-diphosphate kinase [Thaumarchaeota archaeon]|nr:nucleoside-diphosphate kinase [Nitrososphaerota archaeon]
MTEQTLIIIKPDAVERNLIGEIISRFENKGFKFVKLQMLSLTKEMAEKFYSEHKDKRFFTELVSFITSRNVVVAVIEGENVITITRLMVGATKSFEAAPGSIRGDLGLGITNNIIHASDSPQSFEKEVNVVFT